MTPGGSGSLRVLLVDDNPGEVRLVREALAGSAPPVDPAADGRAALCRLRGAQAAPQLVLLDLNPPGVGGHAVLRVERPSVGDDAQGEDRWTPG